MIYKVAFYILTLAASALYLYQKNEKINIHKDKISDNLDKLTDTENELPPMPIEIICHEEIEQEEVATLSLSNPD